jgi:hypothetical protein
MIDAHNVRLGNNNCFSKNLTTKLSVTFPVNEMAEAIDKAHWSLEHLNENQ